MSAVLSVGIAGLGTVGGGVAKLLVQQTEIIARRCGRRIEIVAASALEKHRTDALGIGYVRWFDNAADMAAAPDIDVIVELIGGSGGIAKTVVETALAHGKHVVTANKALLAHHGVALARLAEGKGLALAYEAAVAGGIPIIKGLREGLAGNQVREVHGILNGTCNYILTEMRTTGRDFAEVLKEAQAKGYAEADPSFDVDGIDTAHKLALLASVTFGSEVNFAAVHVEGIRQVSATDIALAQDLGYRIKLLGIARRTPQGLEQRVHPCMVPIESAIGGVDGVFNAVVADGDFVDKVVMIGRGAGERPTASAVVADLVDIARGRITPTFGVPVAELSALPPAPMAARSGAYYLRLMVRDQVGVLAEVARALSGQGVSIEKFVQRGRSPDALVPVVLTTHDTEEAAMLRGLAAIDALAAVQERCLIRIEPF